MRLPDMVRDATQQEVQALRRENVELKQLVAEPLEGHRLKKTAIMILLEDAGTSAVGRGPRQGNLVFHVRSSWSA